MSFLAPWSMLLAAGIAVPSLLLLYVLKLRRRELRVSSVFLWEQAVKDLQANEPFRRLRLTALFVVQLFALLLIAAAIGRPVIRGDALPSDRIVIVLDRSASMNTRDAPGQEPRDPLVSRFERARSRALALVDQIARSSGAGFLHSARPQAMIVGAAYDSVALTPFTSDLRELRDAIRSLTPTDQPLRERELGSLLRVIAAEAGATTPATDSAGAPPSSDTLRPRPPPAVMLISDGDVLPEALREAAGPGLNWTFLAVGPPPPPPPPIDRPSPVPLPNLAFADNIAISTLSARRESSDPGVVRVFARVLNASPRALRVPVSCRVVDPVTGASDAASALPAQTVTLELPAATFRPEPGAPGAPPGHVEPGEAVASFEINRPTTALLLIETAHQDALGADNLAAILVRPLKRPRVLLVAPTQAQADPFLLGVLDALDIASSRVVDSPTYERLAAAESTDPEGPGGSGPNASFDLVIFDHVTPARFPLQPSLSFAAGLPGPSSDKPAAALAATPPAGPAAAAPSSRFATWDRAHPVMRDVRLDSIILRPALGLMLPPEGRTIELPDRRRVEARSLAISTSPALDLLAELTCRPPLDNAGGVRQRTTRHLLAGFSLDRTNWGPNESFLVFVANAVDYLAGEGFSSAGRFATTSAPARLDLPDAARRVRLTQALAPEPTSADAPTPPAPATLVTEKSVDPASLPASSILPRGVVADLGVPPRAGLAAVEAFSQDGRPLSPGVTSFDALLPINLLDARESTAISRPALDLPIASAGAGTDTIPGETGSASAPASAPGSREIWDWFIAAAAILLALEWFVYAWQCRV